MQVETLKNVPQSDLKNYLRVATISSKTALRYLYVGTDADIIELLSESFSAGDTAENFESAKNIFANNETNAIDVIIIDIGYNEKEIKAFASFLKNRNLSSIPLIYNDHHLKNEGALRQNETIDDIIDLRN